MANYEVNDLVQSHEFGIGTVTGFSKFEDGRDVVIVNFESRGKKKLAIETAQLYKISHEYLAEKKNNHEQWPEGTFLHEQQDHVHYSGNHWEPFFDSGEILKRIPDILKESIVLEGYGKNYPSPLATRLNSPKTVQVIYPNHEMGLKCIIENTSQENTLRSAHPFCSKGYELGLVIERVHVWSNGIEAQIDANWYGTEISFYVNDFIDNRSWFVAKELYGFLVIGIAYSASPAKSHVFKLPLEPKVIQKLIDMDVIQNAEDLSDEFDTRQAKILLPIPDWDRDDFQFQGVIKRLDVFDDFLGQTGWIVLLTVMQTLDEHADQDLRVVITKRAWQNEEPPILGAYVQGTMWLQGSLARVTNKHHY